MEKDLFFIKPAGFPFYFITGNISPQARTALDNGLSYTVKNSDYAIIALAEKHAKENIEREKRGEPLKEYPPWDGKVRFLKTSKRGKLYIPAGLLERSKGILSWYGITVTTRESYKSTGVTGNFEWHGPELRDYQRAAIITAIAKGGGVLSLPTGSGKTLIALKLIHLYGLNTLILVHRKELYRQWNDTIKSVFGISGSQYNNGYRDFTGSATITVSMIQTLHNILKQGSIPINYDLLCLDEAHHTPAQTFYEVATKVDAKYKFGFSATVEREDGDEMKMEAALGPVIVNMGPDALISGGYLARPEFEFIEVAPGFAVGKTFPQIYKSGVVMNNDRNVSIMERALQLESEGRQVYIHVEQIAHGKILSQMMHRPFVYSGSKDREETIDTFRKGHTRILISTLLGEGVDIPQISAIIMAGGRKTEAGTIQKIGRALRPDEKFRTAIIVDFADRGRHLSEHAVARYNTYVKFYGESIVLRRVS